MIAEFEGGSLDGRTCEFDDVELLKFGDTCWHGPVAGHCEKYIWDGELFRFFAAFEEHGHVQATEIYPRLHEHGDFLDKIWLDYSETFVELLRFYTPLPEALLVSRMLGRAERTGFEPVDLSEGGEG